MSDFDHGGKGFDFNHNGIMDAAERGVYHDTYYKDFERGSNRRGNKRKISKTKLIVLIVLVPLLILFWKYILIGVGIIAIFGMPAFVLGATFDWF